MSNMEDYMIDAVARSLKAKHESELSIEEGKWLDWYERTYASDTSELKGNEMNEEQQRQCREAFKAENYVITAVDLFGNGDLFDFVNIYRDGFAAGLAAARGEAVVLNVSAWGNDDKTYVSTTKKHPSGDIEVTTSESSPPPQPAMSDINREAFASFLATHDFEGEDSTEELMWRAWQAARSHYIPDGYCVVPVEPTDEDFKRGVRAFQSGFNGTDNLSDWRAFWQAMIAAGRKP